MTGCPVVPFLPLVGISLFLSLGQGGGGAKGLTVSSQSYGHSLFLKPPFDPKFFAGWAVHGTPKDVSGPPKPAKL